MKALTASPDSLGNKSHPGYGRLARSAPIRLGFISLRFPLPSIRTGLVDKDPLYEAVADLSRYRFDRTIATENLMTDGANDVVPKVEPRDRAPSKGSVHPRTVRGSSTGSQPSEQ